DRHITPRAGARKREKPNAPWLTFSQQSRRKIRGEALAMIILRLAAAAAGLCALFLAGLGVGDDPARRTPTAREIAAAARTEVGKPRAAIAVVALAAPKPVRE